MLKYKLSAERKIKHLKLSAFILFQVVFVCFFLETISQYFLSHSKNALYRARVVLQADAEYGWLLRSGLSTTFEGSRLYTTTESLRTDSEILQSQQQTVPSQMSQLLVLGPSSAFGWGVEYHETYGAVLAHKLSLRLINAAQIGHSALQGKLLWEKKFSNLDQKTKPQYVLLAYGINDLDRFRFYGVGSGADEDFFSHRPLPISQLNYAEKYSDFLTLFSLTVDELTSYLSCHYLSNTDLRRSPQGFMTTMQDFVSNLQQAGAVPIIINTPFFLPQENPSYSRKEIEDLYETVRQLAENGSCRQARLKLLEAKNLEPQRVREDVLELNSQLKSWAQSENLLHIDAYNLLRHKEHFVDPVHPSALGHKTLAEAAFIDIIKSGIKNESE